MILYFYEKRKSGDRLRGNTMRTAQEDSHVLAKDTDLEEVFPHGLQGN